MEITVSNYIDFLGGHAEIHYHDGRVEEIRIMSARTQEDGIVDLYVTDNESNKRFVRLNNFVEEAIIKPVKK